MTCWTDGLTFDGCCDESFGESGNRACWDQDFTFVRCCGPRARALASSFNAECIESDTALRHAGEHALFADVSVYGHTGCFQNNCRMSDKFDAQDRAVCARLCAELEECTHWTFGEQDGAAKCFLRKSDGGRAKAKHWSAGSKDCAPTRLPDASVALSIAESEGVKACDKGKTEKCPDVLAAVTTWRLAIKHLLRAATGRVDGATMEHITAIGTDTEALEKRVSGEFRPSDADFPRVVYNNRLIFDNLRDWMLQHPRVELSTEDASLPNPLRFGTLCGKISCYER